MDEDNGAMIIFDEMPGSCLECSLNDDKGWCVVCNRSTLLVPDNKRSDWCPFRPIPEQELVWGDDWDGRDAWAIGWNDCLKYIRRKKE